MKHSEFKLQDELLITVRITDIENPSEAISELQRHLFRGLPICKGVIITTIWSKTYGLEEIKNKMKIAVLKELTQQLETL